MELAFIDQGKLAVSRANMRHARKAPDIADLLPSVRARGVIVPLIVRASGAPDGFEIIAGRRRFFAAQAVRAERAAAGDGDPLDSLPCAIMAPGDDAAALEASLIENIARADAHEVELWETFTRLVMRESRTPDEIALTFGLSAIEVKRILALGNLLPKVRDLYRKGEIDPASVRLLTMASKSRQREWLALLADPNAHAPFGANLRNWLFGGAAIPTTVALFDLAEYPGEIVADLFGEGGYFACPETFWTAQRAAIAARAELYQQAGWREVVVLEPGSYFNSWEHEKVSKRRGGRIYVALTRRGEATFHEGYLPRREARRSEEGEAGSPKPAKPEVTATLQSYIDLHRHAAVRARLIDHPGVALRLMVAHAIGGSHLVRLTAEPQRGASDKVTQSVASCAAEALFGAERRAVLALLGLDADTPHLIGGYPGHEAVPALFLALLAMDDAQLLRILAVVMGEALAAGSVATEALGRHLKIDMADRFAVDEAFLELVRDKEVLNVMVADLAGEEVARAHEGEPAKVQKAVIRDCLAGTNGRAQVDKWVPRWLAFPPGAYTTRGGVGAVQRCAQLADIAEHLAQAPSREAGQGEGPRAGDEADPGCDAGAGAMGEVREAA